MTEAGVEGKKRKNIEDETGEVKPKVKKTKVASKDTKEDKEKSNEKVKKSDSKKEGKAPEKATEKEKKPKAVKQVEPLNIAFIGQLPYTATADKVKEYFNKQAKLPAGEITNVRLLTNKETGKSRGMAFVEIKTRESLDKVLQLHQCKFDGRKINVEESSQGGKQKRKLAASESRVKLQEKRKKEVDALVAKMVSENPSSLFAKDFDTQIMKMMYSDVPLAVSKAAIEEFMTLDFTKVANRTAYLTGVVKKHHAGTDAFREPPPLGKRKGKNRFGTAKRGASGRPAFTNYY